MCDQTKFIFDSGSCEIRPSINPAPVGPSCLRSSDRKKEGITRNVSFPDDDSQIVTGILEPENPWKSVFDLTNEDLISRYVSSCKKHGTHPISAVLDQLSKIELKKERNELFSLQGVTLNPVICETLEVILKHIQFERVNLESTALDDEASVALFDMLEYYESATHLNISSNQNIGVRGWQACARMIKKACCLERLEARNTTLNEVLMPILGRALKVGSQLQVLKLENCNLSGRPLIILASALKVNSNLKELYLGENCLGISDANQLGSMLKCNSTLQLLDISHNEIKDAGFNYIIEGIIEQCSGLLVLMVWNNELTRGIVYTVSKLLDARTDLQTLNVGQNAIGDECLRILKEPLITNRNIKWLGLQSTCLTNESAFIVSDVIRFNKIIERIDLRDNKLQESGLTALLESVEANSHVVQIDLDRLPHKSVCNENTASSHTSLVEQIRKVCACNKRLAKERIEKEEQDAVRDLLAHSRHLKLSGVDSRKISLTCESLQFRPQDIGALANVSTNFLAEPKKNGRLRSPAPSPIPSPVSSPSPVRNRFHVSRVTENQSPSPPFQVPSLGRVSSRFKVTVVQPEEKATATTTASTSDQCDSKQIPKARNEADNEHVTTASEARPEERAGKKEGSKITERIRKLSWVGPLLPESMPPNIEKIFGIVQNSFVRQNKQEESGSAGNERTKPFEQTKMGEVKDEEVVHASRSGKDSSCPATWPQKLVSSFLSSPNRSSPNILETTAIVFLQGRMSSDPAGFNPPVAVSRSENTANEST